jgi:hypothetical protein
MKTHVSYQDIRERRAIERELRRQAAKLDRRLRKFNPDLAAAFAGVSGGYSANLLLGTVDPLLAGLSEEAARIIDPSYLFLLVVWVVLGLPLGPGAGLYLSSPAGAG